MNWLRLAQVLLTDRGNNMQFLIIKVDTPTHNKGDIVEVRATSTPFGGSEINSFVIAECPDPMNGNDYFGNAWELIINYEVVNSDLVNDEFRMRLFSTLVDSINNGAVTREMVETFINNWGSTVYSFETNEVVFDISIEDAIKSQYFWGTDVSSIVFTETGYEQPTGVHTVEVDYSALNKSPTHMEVYMMRKGATVIAHANRVITIEIARNVVRADFEKDIREKAKKVVAKRRYYVNLGVVDFIEGQGGSYQTDLATLLSYVHDKVGD